MGTKIKSAEGQDVDTGRPVDLDLKVPEVTSMKHDPKMGGWVVEHQIEFSFKHVGPKIRLLVTVELNGKVLRLTSNDVQNDVPPETENAVVYGSRMCLYY
jgi:hypothetical protein